MRTASWLLLGVALLCLAGCSKPKDQIIGKWENTDGPFKGKTLEFSKDGVIRLPALAGLVSEHKYHFVGDDTVEIEMPVFFSKDTVQKVRYTVVINKNEMTATDEKGQKLQFKRVQN